MHVPVLGGEHFARATYPRLHLVKDQKDAVTIAELTQPLEEPIGRDQVAALALNRLDQDSRDFAWRHIAVKKNVLDIIKHRLTLIVASQQGSIRVRKWNMSHPRHGWKESFLLCLLARGKSK